MGMPVTVEITDDASSEELTKLIDSVYDYFTYVDEKFSTYKKTSEITAINEGRLQPKDYSFDMKEVFRLSDKTKKETDGYFDIYHNGTCDPSGLVKGWAIWKAGKILENKGVKNFYIDAGGDVQTSGKNSVRQSWKVGIRNPFKKDEIIKILTVSGQGVATSGTYERGLHIFNPKTGGLANEIASITVVGENIYEADRFATPAFVMGTSGIKFIEKTPGLEGYMIDKAGIATMTSGFEKYL